MKEELAQMENLKKRRLLKKVTQVWKEDGS